MHIYTGLRIGYTLFHLYSVKDACIVHLLNTCFKKFSRGDLTVPFAGTDTILPLNAALLCAALPS